MLIGKGGYGGSAPPLMVFIFLGPQRKLSPLPFSVERQKMKFEASNQFYGVRIFNSPMKPKDGGGIWTINKNNWHLEILTVLIQSDYSTITTLSLPQTKLAELKQKTNIFMVLLFSFRF